MVALKFVNIGGDRHICVFLKVENEAGEHTWWALPGGSLLEGKVFSAEDIQHLGRSGDWYVDVVPLDTPFSAFTRASLTPPKPVVSGSPGVGGKTL